MKELPLNHITTLKSKVKNNGHFFLFLIFIPEAKHLFSFKKPLQLKAYDEFNLNRKNWQVEVTQDRLK